MKTELDELSGIKDNIAGKSAKLEENEDKDTVKNSLEDALNPFLMIAQVFGVLPLSGLWLKTSKNSSAEIKFKWLSPSVFVTLFLIGISITEFFVSFKRVAELGLGLQTTGAFAFANICLFSYILFFKISYHWSHIIHKTRQCEKNFLQNMYANAESENFTRTIRRIITILLLGALVEHLAYKSQAAYQSYLYIKACNSSQDFATNFYKHQGPQIFQLVKFYKWMIPILEWPAFSFTFVWNFLDIFITVMAKSLTIRFHQLYEFISKHKQEHLSIEIWCKVREDVLSLLELLSCYDAKLSALILFSCTNNLYFICMQIFYSFKPMSNNIFELYFWFSLIFVSFRILSLMFTAAALHEVAKRLVSLMYEIPSTHWCLELERLNEVLTTDTIALSGHKFFFLTRGLIMAMLGKIIIYELVLLDKVADNSDPNNSTLANACQDL